MKKNLYQLMRTKRYRKLLNLYRNTEDEKLKKKYAKQLQEMQNQYNVTWNFCRLTMQKIYKSYDINSIFALTKAEDIWRGVEKRLYGNRKEIHFKKFDYLQSIRAKQINRGIILKIENNKVFIKIEDITFGLIIVDEYQKREIEQIVKFLNGEASLTKPCFVTLVPKFI